MTKHTLLIIAIVLIVTNTTRAQQQYADTTHLKSQLYYNEKRNKNNTIGWVCFGTGLTLSGIGLLSIVGSAFRHGSTKTGEGLAVAGEVVTLASIPFFIVANHNKKQAKLALGNQTVAFSGRQYKSTSYPKISLSINF